MFWEPQNASLHHEGGGILLPTVAESECTNCKQYIEWQTYRNRTGKGRKTAYRQGSQVVEVCHGEVLEAKLRGFETEDKPRLTDDFMTKIAIEYMQMMGIIDTQFIIVRHHNTDNPHCHIVYNRINNEGKLISDAHDYRRNEQVTKALKYKYGLTYGTDKSKTNTRKLRNAERAKYEIHNAVKDALKVADSWQKFKNELAKRGVCLELVYKDKERTKVQGIRFSNDGYSFYGTQISR